MVFIRALTPLVQGALPRLKSIVDIVVNHVQIMADVLCLLILLHSRRGPAAHVDVAGDATLRELLSGSLVKFLLLLAQYYLLLLYAVQVRG